MVLQCQRHLTLLPDGTRAGFFIGDAAGVGKGRQVCPIIQSAVHRATFLKAIRCYVTVCTYVYTVFLLIQVFKSKYHIIIICLISMLQNGCTLCNVCVYYSGVFLESQ